MLASLVAVVVMLIAGCGKLEVSTDAGGITATSGTATQVYWTFFNQDFKDFAASRGGDQGLEVRDVYDIATVSHPGIKYFVLRQNITGASTLSGSGVETRVVLHVSELSKQDGISLSASEDISFFAPAFGFTWLTGGRETTLTDLVVSDLCGLFVMASRDRFNFEQPAFYTDVTLTTDIYSCDEPTSLSAAQASGAGGIFLHIAGRAGRAVEGSLINLGSVHIAPHTPWTLTVQEMSARALSRTTLASGVTNGGGHVAERVQLGALSPGFHKIVMTGKHPLGHALVLTNHINVDGHGKFVSVSPESLQPILK